MQRQHANCMQIGHHAAALLHSAPGVLGLEGNGTHCVNRWMDEVALHAEHKGSAAPPPA